MTSRLETRPRADRARDLGLAESALAELERSGFVVVPDFFCVTEVDAAREELVRVLDLDAGMRRAKGCAAADWREGPTPSSSSTGVMHTVLFPSLHCPTLAAMMDRLLESPMGRHFLRGAVGEHYRLRVDLGRITTGAHDVGPGGALPHDWHRDPPGEWTIGIFLADLEEDGHSATAGLPGTHVLPFNPYWDFMLSRPCYRSKAAYLDTQYRYMLDWFYRHNLFQGRVRRFFETRARGMFGRRGDWYFFFNDVWHGRQPNLFGRKLVMVRLGGFATEYPFKDDIPVPEFPASVPRSYADHYRAGQPVNVGTDSLLQRMAARQRAWHLDVFRLASAEKRWASRLSRMLLARWPRLSEDRFLATPKAP